MSDSEALTFEEAKALAKQHAEEKIEDGLFFKTSEDTGDDGDNIHTTGNLFSQWNDGTYYDDDIADYLADAFPDYQ